MSNGVQDRLEADVLAVEERLNELIPPPAPTWRRTFGGATIIAIAIVGSLLFALGFVVPMQSRDQLRNGFSTITVAAIDGDGVLLAERLVDNATHRDVRLTAIELANGEDDGIALIDVQAKLRPSPAEIEYGNCTTSGLNTTCYSLAPEVDCRRIQNGDASGEICVSSDDGAGSSFDLPPNTSPLPVIIPAGESAFLYLLLRPTSCTGPTNSPSGGVTATFDFGAGAFPPVSSAVTLHRPLIDGPDQHLRGDESANRAIAGDNSFLARACRLIESTP